MSKRINRIQHAGMFVFATTATIVLAQESAPLNCYAWSSRSSCPIRSTGNCVWELTGDSDCIRVQPASAGSSTKSGYDAVCVYRKVEPNAQGECVAGDTTSDTHRCEEESGSPCGSGGGGEQ